MGVLRNWAWRAPRRLSELARVPFASLPRVGVLGQACAWGVVGEEHGLGRLGMLGAQQVLEAVKLVREGMVFPLNWPLEQPDPPLFGRPALVHEERVLPGGALDDEYGGFCPQASSQWDALCHNVHPELGVFAGLGHPESKESRQSIREALGIHRWASKGIVGRFVLLDLRAMADDEGWDLDPSGSTRIGVDALERCCSKQRVALGQGDIVLLRTGWLGWYESLDYEARNMLASQDFLCSPGLEQSEEVAGWLWDQGVVAVAADNPAVEAMPFDLGSASGFLHYQLIALLGFALGEFFVLDPLADACRQMNCYEGLFVSAPLNLRGAAGSPSNAVAII